MNDREVAEKISKLGGRMYLVGGAIRDEIMGQEPHDKDYCVTGLSKNEFQEIFPEAKLVGNDFSVFLLHGFEVALARIEKKCGNGHKGFKVENSKDVTIEEDLKRRDLTINAMAKDVLTDEVIDPYGGREDIKRGVIRHVSEAFAEDPLRAYRAARFAAKYEFEIDEKTIELMNNLRNEIETLTAERVFLELKKALEVEKPSIFFNSLRKAGILDIHFKEIQDLIGVPQPEKYHPEGDVYNHTMIVLDKVSKKTKDTLVRYAALVHDLGKAKTPQEILPQHIGHDIEGIELVNNLSNRIRVPTKWKNAGKEVAKYHMKAARATTMRPYKQAVLFNLLNRTTIGLDNLQIICDADDMINRETIPFSVIAKEVITEVTGKQLIQEGYNPNEIGIERFTHMLCERQAMAIKEKEKYYEIY